jgi:dipeptidyl aminopeptidase/acylaminoacyl peptidase
MWQLHAWQPTTDERRQVTRSAVGVTDGQPTYDGEGVLWFDDDTGDESGRWLVQPFAGGESRPFLEGVPDGWSEGLAQAPGIVVAGISNREGFAIHVSVDGGPATELYRSARAVRLGGVEEGGFLRGALSADGTLLCLEHGEHGDLIHPALRVVDPRTGATVGEQLDPGKALQSRCWSPVPGDQRLAFAQELGGEIRPAIWDLSSGERRNLELALTGEVGVEDWWDDGSALLLKRLFEGRHELWRFDPASGELEQLPTEPGTIRGARVRPYGRVWFLHEEGRRRRRLLDNAGEDMLRLPAPELPARPFESWHFANEHGQHVHGFLVTPEGADGPFPVAMFVHGGPTWLDEDRWFPEVQAYVDAGFAVGLVNYRGSTGYGPDWRDTLIGNVGGPELEDVNAGLRDLVARGVADPARAVIAGYSWGGYVTLLELGKHPELWTCGVAGVPIGDYVASYDDMSPLLQEYDRALIGGAPSEVPELMRDRNPINFADDVRAPVLLMIGRNDSRCPYAQAMAYVDKLAARGHPHEVYVFPAGHSAFDIDERVRQVGRMLEFLDRYVPGRG